MAKKNYFFLNLFCANKFEPGNQAFEKSSHSFIFNRIGEAVPRISIHNCRRRTRRRRRRRLSRLRRFVRALHWRSSLQFFYISNNFLCFRSRRAPRRRLLRRIHHSTAAEKQIKKRQLNFIFNALLLRIDAFFIFNCFYLFMTSMGVLTMAAITLFKK